MSFLPYSFHQQNGVSTKMLQSKMIQMRKKLTYNNSRTLHIYQQIFQLNVLNNKNLMVSLGTIDSGRNRGKLRYDIYFDTLMQNTTNATQRANLEEMRQNIKTNFLSDAEKIQLGLMSISQNIIIETQQEINTRLLTDPDYVFYCKMARVGIVNNFVITNMKGNYVITPEKKYIFDLQDESNLGYQLSFSEERFRFFDIEGLTFIGTPGTPGAFVVYEPEANKQEYSIFVYNKLDTTGDSFNVFAYIYKSLIIEVDYNNKGDTTGTEYSITTNLECIENHVEIRASERNGPKFVLEPPDFVFMGNILLDRYSMNKQYGLYYGTYRFYTGDSTNPMTIINRGRDNLIQIYGDDTYKTEYYLQGLDDMFPGYDDDPDFTLDGSYCFYYGDFYIDVIDDFTSCALYSYKYGFNQMENLLLFSETCTGKAGTRTTYEDISQGVIECLYPQTKMGIEFVNDLPFITFNNNNETRSYESSKVYGLHNGQYIVQGIPEDHPIAFINQGKTDYFKYIGTDAYKKTRLGPDNNMYDFFHGSLLIRVYGDFGKITLYDFYHGYAGGYQLFQYSDVCDYSRVWESDLPIQTTPFSTETIYYDISDSFGIIDVDSYLPGDAQYDGVVIDTDKNSIYLTGEAIDDNYKYGFNIGTYVIRNIPEEYAMTFVNTGVANLFSFDGYLGNKIESVGPDGNTYLFYYGNINITVMGNFGQLSYYTINNGYMNGRKKMIYSSSTNMGYAIINNGLTNYFPDLITDTTSTNARLFSLTISLKTENAVYGENFNYFTIIGYDRMGIIDGTEANPTMTFFLGDTVTLSFDSNYNPRNHPFGIYTANTLIKDTQVITNNANITGDGIQWTPNNVSQTLYYYRSDNAKHLISGSIRILPNDTADLTPDISYVIPADGTTVSVSISTIDIVSNSIVNVGSSSQYHVVDANGTTIKSFNASTITGSGTTTLTLNTGMDDYDRLSFDTSYSFVADSGLFTNIYGNDFSSLTIASYRTEVMHDPLLLSIYPQDANDISINPSDPIILTFNEPVYFSTSYSLRFYDTSNVIFSDYTSVETSGNDLLIYNTNMTYETYYRVLFDVNSIIDGSNITYDFTDSSLNSYYFYTAFDPRPKIVSTDPSFGQNDVSFNSTISITFNEDISLGTGNIIIRDLSTNTVFDTFDVANDEDISNHLTGMNTDTLTIAIDSGSTFNVGNSYAVLIDDTSIQDSSGNFFVGITDTGGYTFTVA